MILSQAASRLGGLFLFLSLLQGCATAPQTRALLAEPTLQIPRQMDLERVPFHPQERYQCGPAALATVLNWSGVDVTPQTLVPEVYLPDRSGSLQLELMASTRRHQRLAYILPPHLTAVFSEIAAGNPVLVLQNLGLSWAPTWHFAVVAGYDLDKEIVILRSGLDRRRITPLSTFEHTWARGQHWAMLALRPDQLPATPDRDIFLEASIMLEQVEHWQAALTAYQTTLKQWPGTLLAQLGLGNSRYQLDDKTGAAQAFQAAVADHPESGIAHNNLAQVLLELGDMDSAQRHATQAVNLGGPHSDAFKATLQEIEAKRGR